MRWLIPLLLLTYMSTAQAGEFSESGQKLDEKLLEIDARLNALEAGEPPVVVPPVIEIDFYIDPDGNDNNNGLTPGTAWATVSKVNGEDFLPGDVIAFERGGTWYETLNLGSSGEAGNPIYVMAYGSGDAPVFDGERVRRGIKVTTDFLRFSDLHVTNADADGIRIDGARGGELIDIEISRTVRGAGVRFMGSSTHGWTVYGGVSHDAGANTGNDPSGYFFSHGAHDNLLIDVETYNNAGDGIQWYLTSGNNNNVRGAYLHNDKENEIDIKAGSHTIENSLLTNSRQGVIIVHRDTVRIFFSNSEIRQDNETQKLLFIRNNSDFFSSGNVWIHPTHEGAIRTDGDGRVRFEDDSFVEAE